MTGDLNLAMVKPALIKNMVEQRVDPELFRISRHYVGDLAETASLIWPAQHGPEPYHAPHLSDVVETLRTTTKSKIPPYLIALFDTLDASGRYALIKLATGALRMGVSARLAKTAVAQAFAVELDQVEEAWHALTPPFLDLFAWAEGKGPFPADAERPIFRPFMLAHPLGDNASIDLDDYAAEWKWDGIRVQVARVGGEVKLFSRTGDDISGSFPEIGENMPVDGVLDGELLVRGTVQGESAGSFNALQQRLGRKRVTAKMIEEAPAFVRLYDLLFDGDEDLRDHDWQLRRERLEAFARRLPTPYFDVSEVISARDFGHLSEILWIGVQKGPRYGGDRR